MTVIVTGDRHWHANVMADRLIALIRDRYGLGPDDTLEIRHGAAPGIDITFHRAALRARPGIEIDPHPADWASHGKGAGPRRNAEMVRLGADLCLACHRDLAGSRGTKDCVRRCLAAGIPVWLVDAEDAEPRPVTEIPR